MARTVAQVQAQLTTAYVTAMTAIGVTIDPTQWSRRNLQQLILNIMATGTAIFEQIYDAYTADIEALIAVASPQTGAWFQSQMLAFQFNATNPQILQFNTVTYAPYYPNVNSAYQVIRYCSVVPGYFGTTTIKVAAQAGGFPVDLNTAYPGALSAAQSYVNLLSAGGITYNVQSGNSDKIYIDASVYYQGAYSAIIKGNVINAIQACLAAIPFNGVVLLSNIEAAIKAVVGVNDVVFNNVQARADITSYGSGTVLVTNGTETARKFATVSGYIVGETTTGHTLADSLQFTAE